MLRGKRIVDIACIGSATMLHLTARAAIVLGTFVFSNRSFIRSVSSEEEQQRKKKKTKKKYLQNRRERGIGRKKCIDYVANVAFSTSFYFCFFCTV